MKYGFLLSTFFMNGSYINNEEYFNLDDEEKANIDYFNKCLFDSDEKFRDACTEIMFLMLEISTKLNDKEEISDDVIKARKELILDGFNDEEKQRLETFMYACIQSMGIYSEERVQERKLRRERK
jgi:hypothetical protein